MPDARYYEHHCRQLLERVYTAQGVEVFMSSPLVGVELRSLLQLIHEDDRGDAALARVERFVSLSDVGGW